jgi:hypothetical protein
MQHINASQLQPQIGRVNQIDYQQEANNGSDRYDSWHHS